MLALLKRLMWDESAFVGLARGLLLAAGTNMMMQDGTLRLPQNKGEWTALGLVMLGGYIRSSSAPGASPAAEVKP